MDEDRDFPDRDKVTVLRPVALPDAAKQTVAGPDSRLQNASDPTLALVSMPDMSSTSGAHVTQQRSGRNWLWLGAAVAVTAIATAVLFWLTAPPTVPVVESVTQLSDDGLP